MEKERTRDVPEPLVMAQDDSPAARSASTPAIQIAQRHRLSIRGVYVIDATLILDTYSSYQAELGSAEYSASCSELSNRFQEHGEAAFLWLESQCRAVGVAVTSTIEFGRVPEVILRKATQATLLALGRRGHNHAAAFDSLGQHFRTIAHQVQPPVLVGGEESRAVQRVLLAYNESEPAQRALAWASLLQRTLSAEVVVVTIEEDPTPNRQWIKEMEPRLAQSGLVNYQFVRCGGQPSAEVVATATNNKTDLIVMGGYRHGVLLEWLIGSTVDQVLRYTPVPVLVAGI